MKHTIVVPRRIKIGPFSYDIKLVRGLRYYNGASGHITFEGGTVELDDVVREPMKSCHFLHEMVHAIDINASVGLDEDGVDRMANGFAELLQQLGIKLDYSALPCGRSHGGN